jgi:hypothetical protein
VYEEVIKERDLLAAQLTRRDDELKLVYEKYKLQSSTLSRGEIQYRTRMEDITQLKAEIKRLKREKVLLQKSVANIEDLKKELHAAQRDLLHERTRCRALEEELETPMNVHRWRKLEGTEPAMFEKIQKIQTLQKRLIAKTEETVEKEVRTRRSALPSSTVAFSWLRPPTIVSSPYLPLQPIHHILSCQARPSYVTPPPPPTHTHTHVHTHTHMPADDAAAEGEGIPRTEGNPRQTARP